MDKDTKKHLLDLKKVIMVKHRNDEHQKKIERSKGRLYYNRVLDLLAKIDQLVEFDSEGGL